MALLDACLAEDPGERPTLLALHDGFGAVLEQP